MKTYAEKEQIAKDLGASELLELFVNAIKHFKPTDDDFCETYFILHSEIIRRLNRGSTKEGN